VSAVGAFRKVSRKLLHSVGAREVRPRVAIHELGDLVGAADDRDSLLRQDVVDARVGVAGRRINPLLALYIKTWVVPLAQNARYCWAVAMFCWRVFEIRAHHPDVDRGVERLLGIV